MIALIDGDILCYRVGFATNEDVPEAALSTMAIFLEDLLLFDLLDTDGHEVFLTGDSNFRSEVAVTAPYKGNRKNKEKPIHLPLLREYLIKAWGASVSEGQEADDDIAIRATELGEEAIIVSLDKDFNQIPCWHYNFVRKEKWYTSVDEGLRFFYSQILTGDNADNIKGVHRVGPVRAAKMLSKAQSPKEMYAICVEALGEERALENARLLWLRRYHNEIFEPPSE